MREPAKKPSGHWVLDQARTTRARDAHSRLFLRRPELERVDVLSSRGAKRPKYGRKLDERVKPYYRSLDPFGGGESNVNIGIA
jgi:hypothetical protein